TDSIIWNNISGATSLTYTETNTLTQSQWYRRAVSDACGNTAYTSPVEVSVNIVTPGTPSVYPSGQWNAYAYTDNNFGNNGGSYAGYYTEPSLPFLTTNRYTTSQSPSYASNYQGCDVATTNFSVSFKRTGLTTGTYQVDVSAVDDKFMLYINGNLLSSVNCCTPVINVWTGNIASTDDIEIRWIQNTGTSKVGANFTLVTPSTLVGPTIAGTQSICSGDVPSIPLTISTPSSGGCSIQAYQWQSSPDAATWTNISAANSNSYTITNNITAQTYYRLQVTDYCGNSAYSSIDTIKMNALVPSSPSTSTFGNGVWNAYCYSDIAQANYAGYYTEPLLTFSTINRFSNTSAPSSASGYIGCDVQANQYSVVVKRTNFTTGTYQIDVTKIDNKVNVYIDGVQVCSNVNTVTSNIWTGPLSSSDSIRVVWVNNGGNGDLALTFTPITTPTSINPGTITAFNPNTCTNDPAIINNGTLASGGCYANYSWQSSTDGGSTWSTISGATGSSYTSSTTIAITTQYRRHATDICGNTAYSNIVTFTP